MQPGWEQLGPLLGETARLWRARLDERLRPLGLSQARWLVLLQLHRRGDGAVQKALAQWVGIEGPTLVRLLDRMSEDGWIERRELAQDRRAKTVHLTEQARGVIGRIDGVAAQLRHDLLVDLDPGQVEICMAVLRQVRQKAEQL